MKKRIFSLLAVVLFASSFTSVSASQEQIKEDLDTQLCIELTFAFEEATGEQMTFEQFNAFMEKCEKL